MLAQTSREYLITLIQSSLIQEISGHANSELSVRVVMKVSRNAYHNLKGVLGNP